MPGLGGPNTGAFGVNNEGQIVVQAEAGTLDPNHENFCAYNTPYECRGYVWQDGRITPLATLGGNNLAVGTINNRGEVTGTAETGTRDSECPAHVAANFTGPQVLDFEAVIWGPRPGKIRPLRPLTGDSVSTAIWINDKGEAVGASGRCFNTLASPFAGGPHAVLWDRAGEPHNLGTLGGTADESIPVGNVALAVNNETVVTGASALRGNAVTHAFVWTKERGMRDIGTLPGYTSSAGQRINDRGEVVGTSYSGSPAGGPSHAFLWRHGVMTDLNALIPEDSPLAPVVAFAINNDGEIAGFGVTDQGALRGFSCSVRPCAGKYALV